MIVSVKLPPGSIMEFASVNSVRTDAESFILTISYNDIGTPTIKQFLCGEWLSFEVDPNA